MQEKFNPSLIKAVIGLGNPGDKYENTYHNVGHAFIDYLKIKNLQPTIYALKTDAYMNESGWAVAETLKMKNIRPEETIIVHDDSDLSLGNFKFSFGRGSAGHKGIQSVIDALKTENFWRLRIGTRKQQPGTRQKAGNFVLKRIASKDGKILEEVFKSALTRFY